MPFAVSVFGEILAWTKDEYVVLYKPMLNEKHILLKGADFIETYLSDPAIQEEYLEKQLFNDAKELLGEVSGDECYIFELLPIIGGEKTVEHLRIGKTLVYLQIINEFLS